MVFTNDKDRERQMVTFYKRMKLNGALRNQASLDFLDEYDTTEIFDERWLAKNRRGKFMPGVRSEEEAGFINPSIREKIKKSSGWKKLFRIKNHA